MSLTVNFAGVTMKNPVTVASGTFGYGQEYAELFDLNQLGGIFTKGTSLKPRPGNPPPRTCETPAGMLNAIGLQNPGLDYVASNYLTWLRQYSPAIFVNAVGSSVPEYVELCRQLNTLDIDGVELNLSCPNTASGLAFGTSYDGVKEVTSAVRKVLTHKPLIVKLSPNVTDIKQPALAAQDAGADGISLINTFLAMAIDTTTRKPIIANNTGGLSGPAIRPIAVRMTYDVAHTVKIPVLGMGGIITGNDALEFLIAGATAISIGTGNFYSPDTSFKVIQELKDHLKEHHLKNITNLIGSITLN
jgi:dihydroorotate dehydrogenase (NAD+) catalytic subunit